MKLLNFSLIFLILIILCECTSIPSWERKQNEPYYGMTKFAEDLYVDITEVTVDTWMTYYEWMREKKGISEASKVLPDSNCISQFTWKYIKGKIENINIIEDTLSEKFITFLPNFCKGIVYRDSFYLQLDKGKKLKNFCPYGRQPVTGLTHEQVIEYCAWKTELKGIGITKYRLPTNKEWIQIAVKGLSDDDIMKYKKDSLCGKDMKCATYNYKYSFKEQGVTTLSIVSVAMFSPNKFGIYDLFGNVSEMTMKKGEAKGGNYSLYASQCHTDSIQKYEKPGKWLGFRCVAEEK